MHEGKIEGIEFMYALFVSLLFAGGMIGSLILMATMLRHNADKILSALAGEHLPDGFAPAPVVVSAPRHARRNVRRLGPPPSLAQLHRAAVA